MSKEKKRSFMEGDVVYNKTVGTCDVLKVYYTEGKRRLTVQDTKGYRYENIRPKELIKCDEVFVPECIYIYGSRQYRFIEDIQLTRVVDADHCITEYVGYMDERTDDNLAYVGRYKGRFPSDATGTIHELVADGTLVPQTARHIQIQKHNLQQQATSEDGQWSYW